MMAFDEEMGRATKCTLCDGKPKCVEACPADALMFGQKRELMEIALEHFDLAREEEDELVPQILEIMRNALLLPHGVPEIGSILVAGGAGLVLARSLLFPGDLTLRRSFAEGGREALMDDLLADYRAAERAVG